MGSWEERGGRGSMQNGGEEEGEDKSHGKSNSRMEFVISGGGVGLCTDSAEALPAGHAAVGSGGC